MSNPDKPFVVQHSVPASVVATGGGAVRHAPVREDNGCITGQEDIGCDTSDRVVFEAVWKNLPRDAVWYASNLKPATKPPTPFVHRLSKPAQLQHGNESHLPNSISANGKAHPRGVLRQPPIEVAATGLRRSTIPAPGRRKDFMDLYNRVPRPRSSASAPNTPQGRDLAVAHGGTIKAAIGLALGNQRKKPRLYHRQCSVTRLDHLASDGHQGWRIPMVNSSRGSRMPRITRCTSRPDRKIATASKTGLK